MERGRRALVQDDGGWSLVELIVVVGVLGVLLSFGLATFAGATEKAQGRAVQSELRGALEVALIVAQDAGGQFVVDDEPLDSAILQEMEPGLRFADAGTMEAIGVAVSAGATTIRLDKVDENQTRHTLVAVSGLGMRFCTGDDPTACELEVRTSETPVPDAPPANGNGGSGNGNGNGNGGSGRQDGGTPAADHRQNGR